MNSKKTYIEKNTSHYTNRRYFFVFQNKTYQAERMGKYLWAPKSDKNGRRVSHWIMMKEIRAGDVIFHSVNKEIKFIGIALTDCYPSNQPEELKKEQMWPDAGYRVDCKYIDIQNTITTTDHMNAILALQPAKYAPFNNIGRGNTGYLFSSNIALSKFLFDKLTIANKYLSDYNDDLFL